MPACKGHLAGAWKLHSAWGKLELPIRALPMSLLMLQAMCGLLWAWHFEDMVLVLLLGYHALLRTGEMLSVQAGQITFGANGTALLSLPETKGTSRKGAIESVSICDAELFQLLKVHLKTLRPGDYLLRRTPAQFRAAFGSAAQYFKFDVNVKPYSIRRGGTTHFFQITGSLDATVDRGRWGNVRTARIYIVTALTEVALFSDQQLQTQRQWQRYLANHIRQLLQSMQ